MKKKSSYKNENIWPQLGSSESRPKRQLVEAVVLLALSFTMVLTKSSPALYDDRTCNKEVYVQICTTALAEVNITKKGTNE